MILQTGPGAWDDVVVLVVVVVVVDELADVGDGVDVLAVASADPVADDDADVVAPAGAVPFGASADDGPPGVAAAVVWVLLTVVGCGLGLGLVIELDALRVELTAVTVSAPAATGRSSSITAAPVAAKVSAIAAMYDHLRTSNPLTYSPSSAVCRHLQHARSRRRSQGPN